MKELSASSLARLVTASATYRVLATDLRTRVGMLRRGPVAPGVTISCVSRGRAEPARRRESRYPTPPASHHRTHSAIQTRTSAMLAATTIFSVLVICRHPLRGHGH